MIVLRKKKKLIKKVNEKKIKKISYMEQRELDQIQDKLEKLEQEIENLKNKLGQQDSTSDFSEMRKITEEYQKKIEENEALFLRWQELEDKK